MAKRRLDDERVVLTIGQCELRSRWRLLSSRALQPWQAWLALPARITRSNWPYAGDDEPRRDEAFDFRFPGVHVDFAQHAFVASGRSGELIPVARFQGDRACGWIDLAPNAKMYLVKEHGRVTATLTATSFPRRGIRWIEMDNNFSL